MPAITLAFTCVAGYVMTMSEARENLTLRLLQELRDEVRQIREEQQDHGSMLKDVKNRIEGNTVMLSMLAGMVHDHEICIEKLEVR